MTDPGGPGRRGRHSAGDGTGGFPAPPRIGGGSTPAAGPLGLPAGTGPGSPPRHGLLDRHDDPTGPLPGWWSAGSDLPSARHTGGDDDAAEPSGRGRDEGSAHPSAPLPPMPTGVWNRLQPRTDGPVDDDATVAAHHVDPDADRGQHPADDTDSWDRTGGLEVLGAHDDTAALHGDLHHDEHPDADHDDEREHEGAHDAPEAAGRRSRRRRRPVAVLLSLLVLGGLVVGIVLGVQALIGLTEAEDYTGQGTGTVEIRVAQGDTLSDIARTLADADVIASTRPFVDAAEGNAAATGIQPGVYGLRAQMSGQAALDMLLSEESRLLTRVTIPEGLTVARTLERIASETGRPIEELQAAAGDPVALGLPAYANGQAEGYLFPATYDIEPDDTAADILRRMVQQYTTVAGDLQLEARAAAVGRTPAEVVTIASMIQSETRLDEERPDVAQVVYNRLSQGIPLGIDATLAFGLGKSGNDLTVTDLRTDSPYNTRTRGGLPPTPISSPGEASLEAALAPSTGDLLYYVLESADGNHFFTADYAEFQAARQRCADAGLGCGG